MTFGDVDLNPQFVQAVRDVIDIVDIASQQTRLKKAGRRHEGLCPLHKEKTPSFSVDPVQGLFYCHGCGAGGDAIKLHMLLSGDDFPAAMESLALRYGIPIPRRSARSRRAHRGPDLQGALEAAAEFFSARLAESSFARSYLEKRRIPAKLAKSFGLGYAPDGWDALLGALSGRIPEQDLVEAGLVGRSERAGGKLYDRFRHRLIFPIHTPSGRLVGFGGRTLGDDKAKYINSRESESFHKSYLLYGLHQARRAIRDRGRVLLVEGYMDVLAAVAAGIDWAVGGMGTALTAEQARLLARYTEEVVLGYDGDRAGAAATGRSLPILLGRGLTVSQARFGEGHDPDSLRLELGEEALRAAVEGAEDAVVSELRRLAPVEAARDPRLQTKAAAAVGELLKPIPDAVLRFGYARSAAERLGVPVDILARRFAREASDAPAPPPASAEPSPRLVATLEERLLERLLEPGAEAPRASDLPPEETFLDPVCRNIFRAFLALNQGKIGSCPDVRAVTAALENDQPAIDRLARIMIRQDVSSREAEVSELSAGLLRRWQKQRQEHLVRRIREAQLEGDAERLDRLLQEKTELSRSLHRSLRHGDAG